MSRHKSAPAYGQRLTLISENTYRMSWVVDFYYASSRLRFPRVFKRLTDRAGATRFARKWKLELP